MNKKNYNFFLTKSNKEYKSTTMDEDIKIKTYRKKNYNFFPHEIQQRI